MTDTQPRPPLDSFESALLAELRQHVVEHPVVVTSLPTRRRRRLRVAATAAATGIAASVATVAGLGGLGGPSPAYAVERDASGDVVVTIHRLDDAAGLEQALKAKGIDADVSYDADGGVGTAGLDGDGPGALALPSGAQQDQDGGSFSHRDAEKGPTVSGSGPAAAPGVPGEPDDPCGPIDPAPATLSHSGDDWVLSIPAASPLQDRHVDIGTAPDGTLSVQYAGSQSGSFCGVTSRGAGS